MRTNQFYEKYLRELPDGLQKSTGRILERFRGADRAISRTKLVMYVASEINYQYHNEKDFANLDRRVRRAIEIMRGSGWLIGSTVSGDGYYICQTWQEYDEFRASYTSSAFQVMETARTMDLAAKRLFGDPNAASQPALIEG